MRKPFQITHYLVLTIARREGKGRRRERGKMGEGEYLHRMEEILKRIRGLLRPERTKEGPSSL